MKQKLILGYWNVRGLSERCRMVLEYVGLHYDQVVYNYQNRDKWFK